MAGKAGMKSPVAASATAVPYLNLLDHDYAI